MIISVLLTFAVAIVAVMFALANTDPVRIVFYGYAVDGQVGLFMLIALGIGILLGILLMLPSLVGRTITVVRTKRRLSELEAKPREVKPAEVKPKNVTPPPPPASDMLTHNELLDGFRQTGVKAGDTIVVHTSYKSLGGVDGGAEAVIDVMHDLVGPTGTVLFPAFNFQSWTETHYFDVLETPSKMGMITELARLRPDAKRTPHPIFSFSVWGARADEFSKTEDVEAYGPHSAFALFHKLNATIISIGLDFNNSFSMHHYIEYNVGCDYRRVKEFSGIYVGYDRVPRVKMHSMFVRNSDRVKTYIVPGMNELLAAGSIKEIQVGAAKVHFLTANEFFDNMSVIVREHPEKLHYVEEPKY